MTDLFNTLVSYLHDVFIIQFDGWVILGFVAQGFFTMRFVVQWIASERARASEVRERERRARQVVLRRKPRLIHGFPRRLHALLGGEAPLIE